MESQIILKVRWKNPLIGNIFQLYGDFLPHLYHKIGCEICIERVADGALVFYKTMDDFVKCHQLADLVTLPKPGKNIPPNNRNGIVELFVEAVKLPTKVTADDLLPGVAKSYQIISDNIEVEKLSESSAVIRYKDAFIFEAIIDFFKDFWDQNKDVILEVPKKDEVTKLFFQRN